MFSILVFNNFYGQRKGLCDIIKSGALDCLVELFYLKEYCNALIWFFIFVIFFQNQCNIIFSAKFSLFLKKKSGTVLEFFSSVNLIYLAKCFWLKFSKFLIWKEFLKNRTNENRWGSLGTLIVQFTFYHETFYSF